jgi:rhodanese-related sulfurtransferase
LTAAKLADRLGIGKVYSLDGGISNWTRAGLELVHG